MSNFVSLADLRRLGLGQISVASGGGGGGGGGLAVQARQATAYTAPGASRPISFTPIVKTATTMAPVQVAQPSSAISIAPIQKTSTPTQMVNSNAISIARPGVENAAEATNRIRTGGFSIATGIPNLSPGSNSAQTAAQNTYFTPPTVVRESTPLPTAAGVPMISTAYSSTTTPSSTPINSAPPIASRPPTSTPPTETPPPRGGGGPQTSTPFEPISLTTPSPSYTPQFPSNVDYPTPQPQAFPPQQLQFPQQVESGGGYFGSYWISDDEYHGANVKDSDGVNVVSKVKPGSLKQKGDSFSAGLKASFSTTRGKVAAGAIAVGLTAAVAYFGKDYLGLKF